MNSFLPWSALEIPVFVPEWFLFWVNSTLAAKSMVENCPNSYGTWCQVDFILLSDNVIGVTELILPLDKS